MDNSEIKIKEIFPSIQGEGLYVGQYQLFVRSIGCNLNCAFCDTDFELDENTKSYDKKTFFELLSGFSPDVISFTGGEPLLFSKFLASFLAEYKEKLNKKIYLETNGSLPNRLLDVIKYIDVVAMDIKLESATGQRFSEDIARKFIQIAKEAGKEIFIKIVFDEKITEKEIEISSKIAKKFETTLVLQPKMPIVDPEFIKPTFEKFYEKYKNVRLIPQTHKFLQIP